MGVILSRDRLTMVNLISVALEELALSMGVVLLEETNVAW